MIEDTDTKREFATVLTATLVGIYGKPAPDRGVLAMWFAALQRYELADIKQALSRHVGNPDAGQFPPKPADIVRHIDGSGTGTAALAWMKASRAISSVGRNQSVVFDDPLIHAAIDGMGGWPRFCGVKTDELPFLQKRFEAAYRACKEQGVREYPRQLTGVSEMENRANGYHDRIAPPMLIGEPERCRLVLEQGGSTSLQITQNVVDIAKRLERAA